ncbi:MAG: hypothetical protein AAFR60_11195, partial [Pseudomonadota bacterium]
LNYGGHCDPEQQRYRILRGGHFQDGPLAARVAVRELGYKSSDGGITVGFRLARRLKVIQ